MSTQIKGIEKEWQYYATLRNKVFLVFADNGVTLVNSEADDIIARLIQPAYCKGAFDANCFIGKKDVEKMFAKYEGVV
jgi:hypothetical protein